MFKFIESLFSPAVREVEAGEPTQANVELARDYAAKIARLEAAQTEHFTTLKQQTLEHAAALKEQDEQIDKLRAELRTAHARILTLELIGRQHAANPKFEPLKPLPALPKRKANRKHES